MKCTVREKFGQFSFVLAMLGFVVLMVLMLLLAHLLAVPFIHNGNTYFEDNEKTLAVSQNRIAAVILDAGHGGEDGGASTANGVAEKDLNLEITLRLGELLRQQGIAVLYTRTEDVSLNHENIKGKHKLYDLKNRLAIAKQHPDALFISIHMNTFSVAKYNGLQVFYSRNHPDSEQLAKLLQDAARTLQPDNDRNAKKAGSSIFLLDRCKSPAVLIECGFLSNPGEAERLLDDSYQISLAGVLSSVINTFYTENAPFSAKHDS